MPSRTTGYWRSRRSWSRWSTLTRRRRCWSTRAWSAEHTRTGTHIEEARATALASSCDARRRVELVRVEDRLVLGHLRGGCSDLIGRWVQRVCGWRQCAELQHGGHEQDPGLGRGQVAARDENGVVLRSIAAGVAPATAYDGHARERRHPKRLVRGTVHAPVRAGPFADEAGEG